MRKCQDYSGPKLGNEKQKERMTSDKLVALPIKTKHNANLKSNVQMVLWKYSNLNAHHN